MTYGTSPEGYIDGITLQIDAGDLGRCSAHTEAGLGDLRTALEIDIMVLNTAKQEVLGLTKAFRDRGSRLEAEPQ